MSFFRSDDMQYFRIILPRDSAWDTLNELGKYNLIHVVPNESINLQRPFIAQVKRCEQCLLKIKNLDNALENGQIAEKRDFISEEEIVDLTQMWELHEKTGGSQTSRFGEVEEQINRLSNYHNDLLIRKDEIKQKLLFLRQNIAIVKAGEKQYGQSFFQIKTTFFENPQHASIFGLHELQIKAIVAQGNGAQTCQRIINRMTRGNTLIHEVKFTDIFDYLYPGQQNKFVIFFIYPAKKNSTMDKKVIRIIQNYCKDWENYILPQTDSNYRQKMVNIEQAYAQTKNMLEYTQNQEKVFLGELTGKVQGKTITQIQYYKYFIIKQKEIYDKLNEMSSHSNFIDGEVYIRKDDVEQAMEIIHQLGVNSSLPMGKLVKEENSRMPTHFQLNDYKMAAQQITNTYGVPDYQEGNPSFFTIVTFPFMFGVMFGDIAHGLIIFALGLVLIFKGKKSKTPLIHTMYQLRYFITMMGFFSFYCGFLYNDFLSLSLRIFPSCYNIQNSKPQQPIPRSSQQCVYPFGVDPVWSVSSNYLNFINSLKMKISVIIGVLHMIVGVFVKASNAIYFRRKLEFIFQFIPQIVFMVVLFGYMDFLIVYKWLQPWKLYDSSAPSIITTMINMPLKVGKTDKCCGGEPMWGEYEQTTQDQIQFILLVLAAISVPLMLFPKPIIEILSKTQDSPQNDYSPVLQNQEISKTISSKGPQEHSQDNSQIFVHQLIQTIQYVLGCISNTASYLRLWALSLAHSQLSEVFLHKTIASGIESGTKGLPMMILGFPILAAATFGVLLCMDSMECFLHTLRLHWVQFQNKFYKGNGFLFKPLSFKTIVQQAVDKGI